MNDLLLQVIFLFIVDYELTAKRVKESYYFYFFILSGFRSKLGISKI